MKRLNDLLILELASTIPGGPGVMSVSAIVHKDGLILVDAGLPGMLPVIEAELQAAGYALSDIRQVIVTHHDLDHIGGLPAVLDATGAEVMALEAEIPYISGEKRPQKLPSPEQIETLLADPNLPDTMRAFLTRPPVRVPVDRALHDGDLLPWAGGIRVIATPGHTEGHLSLLLERSRTLISGDALTSQDGQLHGPSQRATPDLPTAMQSVQKLAALDVQNIVTYHGGLVTDDAAEQLRRVAAG